MMPLGGAHEVPGQRDAGGVLRGGGSGGMRVWQQRPGCTDCTHTRRPHLCRDGRVPRAGQRARAAAHHGSGCIHGRLAAEFRRRPGRPSRSCGLRQRRGRPDLCGLGAGFAEHHSHGQPDERPDLRASATPPGRARMVNGRHDRAGSGCQPSGPGKPAYPGRYRSRDREGSAPPALRHRVRPEPREASGPALPEESSRRSQRLTSTPSSSTQASTGYPPPHFTASTSQLSDGWPDRTQRAGWWEIFGCPRWSPTEPWISTSGRPTPGSWPAACPARSCFSLTMPATPSCSRTQQGSSQPSRPL